MSALSTERRDDVLIVWIDVPGEPSMIETRRGMGYILRRDGNGHGKGGNGNGGNGNNGGNGGEEGGAEDRQPE